MKQAISTILAQVGKAETEQEKIMILHTMWHESILTVLRFALNPDWKTDFPEGPPPYEVNNLHDQEGQLYGQARMLKYLSPKLYPFESMTPFNAKMKREGIFIRLLEQVDKRDAKMLCEFKDGKFVEGIDKEWIIKLIPRIMQNG
jgi:hypothetical protein